MSDVEVINIDPTKRLQINRLIAESSGFGLKIAEVNAVKPWGGYLRFTQDSWVSFLSAYWFDVKLNLTVKDILVDPKLLLVGPKEMLSLQRHDLRRELWRVIDGPVRVTMGDDWDSLIHKDYYAGEVIDIPQAQWHRLIGLNNWGRVAEIWQHTDPLNLSNEADIFREHDIYDRAKPETDTKWKSAYPYPD